MRHALLLLTVCLVGVCADSPEVETSDGKLAGKYMVTRRGRRFSAFLGIPYAKPPIGDLRFKAPEPNDPWEGVRNASEDANVCYQRNPYTRSEEIIGDEDCLYLNVYTPQLPSFGSDPLPVLVFLHGGGWVCGGGGSQWYGPDILLDRDVVLVVVNYRLGALGFLGPRGNQGLKDQAQALRWVRDHVEAFGGDPNRVGLFGESAGGASTEMHMISPLSKGLFHVGISQSGTSLCSWAFATEGESKKNAEKLAKSLNCPIESTEEMIDCLRKVDAYDIIAKDYIFWEWDYDPMIPFKPMIEEPHDGAFLTQHPREALEAGRMMHVPWITGITSGEGALRVAGLVANSHLLEEYDRDFDKIAPMSLFYENTASDVKAMTKKIREFYFGNDSITVENKDKLVDMYTDGWFLNAADESIRIHLKHNKAPVYLYYFDHRGVASFSQIFGDPSRNYGVCHADELQYLFPVSDGLFPDQKPDECDKNVAEIVTSLWVSFAKTGVPTAQTNEILPTIWEPVTSEKLEYLHIGSDSDIRMESSLLPERVAFWKSLDTTEKPAKDEL